MDKLTRQALEAVIAADDLGIGTDMDVKFASEFQRAARLCQAALAAPSEPQASEPPELSDKDGWLYDPDAKLAEIRAGMKHASEPRCKRCNHPRSEHSEEMPYECL